MANKRAAFTESEKAALRQQHQQHRLSTQKELSAWFESQFGKPIRQVSVSEILSSRYSHLDQAIEPARKKQRKPQYQELEDALA